MADVDNLCLMSVNCTDCLMQEPMPFNKKWYSNKLNGPGVRYELCVCVMTGWIVSVNGWFPCGQWPDKKIAKIGIEKKMEDWERCIADRGYTNVMSRAWTPDDDFLQNVAQVTGHVSRGVVRARHEGINSALKKFKAFSMPWRHPRLKHETTCKAILNLIQIGIMNGEITFQVDYEEEEIYV